METADQEGWARSLATTLSQIHAITFDLNQQVSPLLDANAEASWFLSKVALPDFMQVDPSGPSVWEMANRLMPEIVQVEPILGAMRGCQADVCTGCVRAG